jgi:hypothetical protein
MMASGARHAESLRDNLGLVVDDSLPGLGRRAVDRLRVLGQGKFNQPIGGPG